MAEQRFTFNASDADALLQTIGGIRTPFDQSRYKSGAYLLKAPGGGIAARSGTTVSSATCECYYIDGTTLTATGFSLPVFNMSTTAVAANAYILAVMAGSVLICNWEDC